MPNNEELIPRGDYCYGYLEKIKDTGNLSEDLLKAYNSKVCMCPFFKRKEINGVEVYWCDYLNAGGLPNEEINFQKLVEFYGSEDIVYENLPLSLLFDAVKCCGVNIPDDEYK